MKFIKSYNTFFILIFILLNVYIFKGTGNLGLDGIAESIIVAGLITLLIKYVATKLLKK